MFATVSLCEHSLHHLQTLAWSKLNFVSMNVVLILVQGFENEPLNNTADIKKTKSILSIVQEAELTK